MEPWLSTKICMSPSVSQPCSVGGNPTGHRGSGVLSNLVTDALWRSKVVIRVSGVLDNLGVSQHSSQVLESGHQTLPMPRIQPGH